MAEQVKGRCPCGCERICVKPPMVSHIENAIASAQFEKLTLSHDRTVGGRRHWPKITSLSQAIYRLEEALMWAKKAAANE
jgi:hypothetical protein